MNKNISTIFIVVMIVGAGAFFVFRGSHADKKNNQQQNFPASQAQTPGQNAAQKQSQQPNQNTAQNQKQVPAQPQPVNSNSGQSPVQNQGQPVAQNQGQQAPAQNQGQAAPQNQQGQVPPQTASQPVAQNQGQVPQNAGQPVAPNQVQRSPQPQQGQVPPQTTGQPVAQNQGQLSPQNTGQPAPQNPGQTPPQNLGQNAAQPQGQTPAPQPAGQNQGQNQGQAPAPAQNSSQPSSNQNSAIPSANAPMVSHAQKQEANPAHLEQWYQSANAPGTYLETARTSMAANKYVQASSNLRSAASMMDQLADGISAADSKGILERDARALLKLAQGIDNRQITQAQQLDMELLRARVDLATLFYNQSLNAWTNNDVSTAGSALLSSARYLAYGYNGLGLPTNDELKSIGRYSRQLISKVPAGGQVEFNRVSKIVSNQIITLEQTFKNQANQNNVPISTQVVMH